MCNTNIENNCCHKDDLLCCIPVMHCCGGYSEHNNCCPHNRCCNNPCCCDDGCPFTPECCCCKALKCCKENKEKIEKLSTLESRVIRTEEAHERDMDYISGLLGDIAEKEQNDVDSIRQDHTRDVNTINTRLTNIDNHITTLDDRVDRIEDDVDDLKNGLRQEISDRIENDTITINTAKNYTDTEIEKLKGGVGTAYDTLLEIANELNKDDLTEAAILVAINTTLPGLINDERDARISADDVLRARIAAEETRAKSAEISLGDRITTEVANEADRANAALSSAIDSLDSSIPALTNKAIASVTETNGILSGTYTDTILKAIQDSGGRNIVNTYIDSISPSGNYIHYHTGAGYTDVLVPYATSTSNADITKTLDAVNGDKLQIGTGNAVNITNAVHAVNADNAVKATLDASGNNISTTYLKIANAATDADATLQSASRTKIATVGNTDLHVTMPRLADNISLALDPTTYKITATLKGGNTTISTSNEIDLPLETMVVDGSYDSTNKKVVLTLKNGQTIQFSVADLISGLVNTNDSRLSDARPASDVYSWAKTVNKPTYSYSEITGTPSIPAALIQSDWNLIDNTSVDFIKNKPSLFSGNYNDLSNKPTIPAAQVQSDWNATTGMGVILNKPTLSTVATTGSYDDLINKPTIPTGSTITVTIGGTTYNLETLLTNITNDINTLKGLWTSETDGEYTYLKPVTSTNRVKADGFFDTTVS